MKLSNVTGIGGLYIDPNAPDPKTGLSKTQEDRLAVLMELQLRNVPVPATEWQFVLGYDPSTRTPPPEHLEFLKTLKQRIEYQRWLSEQQALPSHQPPAQQYQEVRVSSSPAVGVQTVRVPVYPDAATVFDPNLKPSPDEGLWFPDGNGNLTRQGDGAIIKRPDTESIAYVVKSWWGRSDSELRGRLKGPNDRIVEAWIPGTADWAKMPFSSVRKGMTIRFTEDRNIGYHLTEEVRVLSSREGLPEGYAIDRGAIPVIVSGEGQPQVPDSIMPETGSPKAAPPDAPKALYVPPAIPKFEHCVRPRGTDDDVSDLEAMLYDWYPKTHLAMIPFMAMVHAAFTAGIREAFEVEKESDRIEIIKRHVSQVPVPDCFDVTNITLEKRATTMKVEFSSNDEARKTHRHKLVVSRPDVTISSFEKTGISSMHYFGQPAAILSIDAEYFEEDE